MTAGPRVDGPVLARWWDRVSPLRPRALWVGTLDLVHLVAPVRVLRPVPIDPLHRLLLRAIEAAGPIDLDRLDGRLGLGRSALYKWLDRLCADGMVWANDCYTLTPVGMEALSIGAISCPVVERRRFTFVLNPDGSAHFLPWTASHGEFVSALAAAADARWLADCIALPVAWKRRAHFPEDVAKMETSVSGPGIAAWKRLVVAHGERPTVALVLTVDTPSHLVGFALDGGDLDPDAPALRLDAGWDEPFPEVATESGGIRADGSRWVLVGAGRLRRAERVE